MSSWMSAAVWKCSMAAAEGHALVGVAADGLAREQADERAVALAGVGGVVGQRPVEVAIHVGVRAVGEERREVVVELLRVALEVELERCGHVHPSGRQKPWSWYQTGWEYDGGREFGLG